MIIDNENMRALFFDLQHIGECDLLDPLCVRERIVMGKNTQMDLYLACDQQGMLTKACFKAMGDPYLLVGLEWLCRQIEGTLLASHPLLNYAMILETLDIPRLRYPAILLIDTHYRLAVQSLQQHWGTYIMQAVEKHRARADQGVIITDAAKQHWIQYMKNQSGCLGVRISVKKTGCSGYSYAVDYVLEICDEDSVFPLEAPYQLFIDANSYPLLKGIRVDYIKQGLNAKLVFENPNQTGVCGCGESFTI